MNNSIQIAPQVLANNFLLRIRMTKQRARNEGFTIIEVIVVIIIIIIIVSVISVVFIGVKERGKFSVDISNLKQIGFAASMYATDYDEKFPLTVRQLIEERRIDKSICVSPSDTTEKGLMWHFLDKLGLINYKVFEPIPRCSYVGLGDGMWTYNQFSKILTGTNPGWLVNWARANLSDSYLGPTGPYQRLLVDSAVVSRYMGYRSMWIEGKVESKVVKFGTFFCDEDLEWFENQGL